MPRKRKKLDKSNYQEGIRLLTALDKKGVSVKKIAERLMVSPSTIYAKKNSFIPFLLNDIQDMIKLLKEVSEDRNEE